MNQMLGEIKFISSYTSSNGHMFSQLNKDGEFGIRFSKDIQEKYMRKLKTTNYRSYGAVMKGYVLMPENMWNELEKLAKYLNESYDYVMSLEPKYNYRQLKIALRMNASLKCNKAKSIEQKQILLIYRIKM